jgi:hypothetical protein
MKGGRERRRKGLVNRLRRTCYGVMLAVTSHTATADPNAMRPLAPPPHPRVFDPSRTDSFAVDNSPALLDQLQAGVRISGVLLGDAPAVGPQLRIGKGIGSLFDDPIGTLRQGAALDLALPDVGSLHLNLFAKRKPRHWALNPDAQAEGPQRAWSLGASVEMVKVGEPGERHAQRSLSIAPQLVLDLDRLLGAPGQLDATVQYAHWRSPDDDRAYGGPVAQATIRWKF